MMITYNVQKGDTLHTITRLFQVDFDDLLNANELTADDIIYTGETLRIPRRTPHTPSIVDILSPNMDKRYTRQIDAIVLHATANSSLQGVVNWFNNPNSKVSAHYTIGKGGEIVRHVHDHDRAWHAGESIWEGRPHANDWSIGIELVNRNDGQDEYPMVQLNSMYQLLIFLSYRYTISAERILAHKEVSPIRKTDPKGIDMDKVRERMRGIVFDNEGE